MSNRFVDILKKNSLAQLFSSKLFVQITTILQSIIISRLLGPEGKGEFTEVILWPTLIGSLSMLGLYTGIVRTAAKPNICEKYNITNSVLYSTLITGVVGSIIALGVNTSYFHSRSILGVAQIYAIYVLIYNLNRGLSAINNGKGDMGIYSISASILNPVYFLCLLILFICNKVTVTTALFSLLLANTCSLLFLYYKRERNKNKRIQPVQKMIGYSLKFLPADFSEPLYLYYDKAIIAFILTPYDLGIYTIAHSAAAMINVISSTFSVQLFSDIARGKTGNLFNYVRLNLLIMSFSAVIMCLILPIAIPLVFGKDFSPAIIPSLILLVVCILQGESMIIERSILAKGLPFVGIKAKLIAMTVFALFAVLFYIINISSIISLSILLVFVQFVYLEYLRYKMGQIFKEKRIIPNRDEMRFYINRIYTIICKKKHKE